MQGYLMPGAGGQRRRRWGLARALGQRAVAGALLLATACAAPAAPAGPTTDRGAPATPVAGAAGVPATALPAPAHLTVNWTAISGSQSPIWMTYESGDLAAERLDVELVNIPSTSRAIQAMVAGEVQLSLLDPQASIQADLAGADMTMFLASTNRLIFSVMSQPSVRQPAALRGQSLGITRLGSSTHTAALAALELWGLQPDRDVALRQLQDAPAIFAALQAGQVEAGVLSPPTNARARGSGFYEMVNLATEGPEYPSVTVGGQRAWINANEDVVRRFSRAYVRGIQRFKTDKRWALEVYRKYFKIDDVAVLEDTWEQFTGYIPSVPHISEPGMLRLLHDMAEEDPRLVGRTPADYVDSRFVADLEQSGFIRQVLGAGATTTP
jgi:NitT/TauT family transport system substrate-binding protein